MAKFVVKRNLPGVTREALASAGTRTKTCCAEMTKEGGSVRWTSGFFLPESSQTHCYFDAATKAAVEELNQRANLPYVEITEVFEMTPDSV